MARSNSNYPGYQETAWKHYLKQGIVYGGLSLWGILMVLPIYWTITTSLNGENVARQIIFFPENFTLENYRLLWGLRENIPFLQWMFNSILIASSVTIFNIVFDSLAGYALAKIDFFAREKIFLLFIATMMVPGMVTIIPIYLLLSELNALNTYYGLMVPFIANPFGIFLFRQFFMGLPTSLGDAARIDGCNELQVFYRIYLPLAKPAVATLGIFVFMWTWNNFEWPLIIMQDREMFTLPVALYTAQGQYITRWGLLMAIAFVLMLPILLLFLSLQKYFIQGMTLSGMKG